MTGVWSGGAANRTWSRPGSRRRDIPGDAELSHRLDAELAGTSFWCDNCGRHHPLREHRDCRTRHPFQTAYRG